MFCLQSSSANAVFQRGERDVDVLALFPLLLGVCLVVASELTACEVDEEENAIRSLRDVFVDDANTPNGVGTRRAVILERRGAFAERETLLHELCEVPGGGKSVLGDSKQIGLSERVLQHFEWCAIIQKVYLMLERREWEIRGTTYRKRLVQQAQMTKC